MPDVRRAFLSAAFLALFPVAACGNDDVGVIDDDATVVDADDARVPTTNPTGTQDAGVIDESRLPHLAVEVGAEVTISNLDDVAHTFTAADGSFDTGAIERGREATFVAPAEPGPVTVVCTIHADMEATLTVV